MRPKKLRPWTPIFDVEKQEGAILVGNTPPGFVLNMTLVATDFTSAQETTSVIADEVAEILFCSTADNDGIVAIDVSDRENPAQIDVETHVDMSRASIIARVSTGQFVVFASSSQRVVPVAWSGAAFTKGTSLFGADYVYAAGMAQIGSKAYVSMHARTRIVVFNLGATVTQAGQIIDATNLPDPGALVTDGTYLFCWDGTDLELKILTVADTPVYQTAVAHAEMGSPLLIDPATNIMWVTSGAKVSAFDISTPLSPVYLGTYTHSGGQMTRAVLAHGYLFVTTGTNDSLLALDISDPTSITLADSIVGTLSGDARGLGILGNYAYVFGLSNELYTVKLTN